MIVSASRLDTGSTVSLSGLRERVDRDRVGDDDALDRRRPRRTARGASPQKTPWVAKSQTSVAPCSSSARTFAIIVPPVMITSSPMIARLPLTRPAISVTRRDVVGGPRLVHDRELGLDHLREALGLLGAAGVGRDGDDAFAVQPEVAEVAREERQRGHVVDGDREEALDLAGVQVHRQHAVGAGELEHVGDEARP